MATLLVVDDDHHIRSMLDVLLTLEGHTVLSADDGAAALDILATTRPDVVILDVMMPTVSGWDVADHIRSMECGADMPIIFTTAKDDDQSQWFGWKLGASSYLTKPYNINDLLTELERILKAGD